MIFNYARISPVVFVVVPILLPLCHAEDAKDDLIKLKDEVEQLRKAIETLEKPAAAPVPAPAKDEELVIRRSDLQISVYAEGTIETVQKKRFKLQFQDFAGPYIIAEIVPSGIVVQKDSQLFRLESAGIEKAIRGTQENLSAAKVRLPAAREEFENLKTANRLKLEHMGNDVTLAQREIESFEKFGEEQMLRVRALQVKGQENFLAERDEELSQLEKMYKDTQLATETKDIVLDRARRNIAVQREQVELARKGETQMKEFEYPTRKEQVHLALEQKKQDLELFKASVKVAENQKAEDLKASERQIRDLEEKLAALNADQQQMTWRAPFTGLVNYRGFEAGDRVNPSVAIIDLLDLSQYEARFTLGAGDLRSVHTGDKIRVRINDLPDLELNGQIEEISALPTFEGQAQLVRFPVKAKIDLDAELRPWLRIHADISGRKLKNVVIMPRNYVYYADGKSYCNLRDGAQSKKHEVTLGAGNADAVEAVKGLSEGDVVVKPK